MLTLDQRREFDVRGYIILRDAIPPKLLRDLREAAESVLAGAGPDMPDVFVVERGSRISTQVQHAHKWHPAIMRFAREAGLAEFAGTLMGEARAVRLWHDQVLYKPARRGGPVNWHQDYFYWRHAAPADLVTSWTAVTASGEESGCLWFMPGSHKWGLLNNERDVGINPIPDEDPKHLVTLAAAQGRHMTFDSAVLRAGDVSLHHCLILHGSSENRSPHDRIGYVQSYMSDHTRYSEFPWSANAGRIKAAVGDTIDSPDFPLLWERHPMPDRS